MKHKDQDHYYNMLYANTLTARRRATKLSIIQMRKLMEAMKYPYKKPTYAIGTTVTYRVGGGYKMGKIIKAFTFKGKWRYVFEGRKDKIAEADIKDIIILNNQELIDGL